MKRIVFVYEYLSLGGVETILATRMKHLKRMGHTVRAMFLQNKGGRSLFSDMQEDEIFIPITPLEKSDFLTNFKPDLIVSIDTPSIIEIAHATNPSIPILYEVHTTYERELRFLKSQKFLQQLSMIVVPSAAQEAFIKKILRSPQSIRIVPNALDERFLTPLEETPSSENPIVTWVGRLDEVKNWRAYLEIAGRVARQHPGASFRLIGGLYSPMDKQDTLWMLIQKFNLESRFHWYPAITPDQMPAMLDQTRCSGGCVISTSRTESFGMSILEAMSRACAVVVPEGGALAELAPHQERGLNYKPNDYDAAAQSIQQLLQTPTLRQRLGEQARSHAISLDGEKNARIFLDAIQELST